MSPNLETLERLIKKIEAGDYDGAAEELHPELELDEPPSLPQGGVLRGPGASGAAKQIIREHWDQNMGELRHWDCGDLVFASRDIEWTSRETGKSVNCPVLEMFEFLDGKIRRITVYVRDTKLLLDTLS